MDLEFLAAHAARASRVYLSGSRASRCRCLSRYGLGEGDLLECGLWCWFRLLLLNGPQRLQDLFDVRLDFRRRRRRQELVEVESILLRDDVDAGRESLVRPDVCPAKVTVIVCPGHGLNLRVVLTCVYKVVYSGLNVSILQ